MTRTVRETLGALAALLGAFAAAVAITWPMIQYTDEAVVGGGELGGWLWRYNWHYLSLEGVQASATGPWEYWRAFVSLGRYPETGNILDILALSYPLEQWLGFPASYNVKVFVILTLNGFAGYVLGRYFSGSIAGGLAASTVAVINPLTLLEVNACGLRQCVLWWVLLYPPLLDRALRRRTLPAGLAAGACFGMAGAWYWFYGLFTALFTLLWAGRYLFAERHRLVWRSLMQPMLALGFGVMMSAGPFVLAYALGEPDQQAGGGSKEGAQVSALPEMTFFLPFPSYDTVSHAPLRPQTYAENVLASINRTIGSSWGASYPFDPRLNEALPLTVMLFGVLPALLGRRSWPWLGVWFFFYLATLGPFLRIGSGDAREVVRIADSYVVRLPFTALFQFVPGMSRMFAPYRLAAFMVVSSVALIALTVSRLPKRAWIAPVVMALTVAQPMYRWGKGAVNEGAGDGREFRSPLRANRIEVPAFYKELDASEFSGIVELPLEQQQDLLYYYQIVHQQKVYRSWATPGALPPRLRTKGTGGFAGDRLRYLSRADVVSGVVPAAFQALSRRPREALQESLSIDQVRRWGRSNNYRRIILHERGYYLVDANMGAKLYAEAIGVLTQALGIEPVLSVELRRGDPAAPAFGVPLSGDLVPWTSQPMNLPEGRAPAAYHMAVFEIPRESE